MKAWIRLVGAISVLLAAVFAISRPTSPADCEPGMFSVPVAATADSALHDWIGPARKTLEAMRIPIRGEKLEALLRSVDDSARRFGIDPIAILAIIEVESEFDPMAVSPTGSMGLMQLRAETAQELAGDLGIPLLSDDLLLDPALNVMLGTYYLSRLHERFGDLDTALAAFHDGPGRVRSSLGEKGTPSPVEYAARVWDAIVRLEVRAIA